MPYHRKYTCIHIGSVLINKINKMSVFVNQVKVTEPAENANSRTSTPDARVVTPLSISAVEVDTVPEIDV